MNETNTPSGATVQSVVPDNKTKKPGTYAYRPQTKQVTHEGYTFPVEVTLQLVMYYRTKAGQLLRLNPKSFPRVFEVVKRERLPDPRKDIEELDPPVTL